MPQLFKYPAKTLRVPVDIYYSERLILASALPKRIRKSEDYDKECNYRRYANTGFLFK